MRILQRNLKRTTDTFLFISHTTNVLLFKFRCNIFIGVTIIKEMPGSVASGTHFRSLAANGPGRVVGIATGYGLYGPGIFTLAILLVACSLTGEREREREREKDRMLTSFFSIYDLIFAITNVHCVYSSNTAIFIGRIHYKVFST